MRSFRAQKGLLSIGAIALLAAVLSTPDSSSAATEPSHLLGSRVATTQPMYAPDFVSGAAYGTSMNDRGDIAGTSYGDPGCGPFCLPPLETVVWKDGRRIVLPNVPGLMGTTADSITERGWVVGFAGPYGFSHAVAWLAQPLDDLLSPAYDSVVTAAGPMNASGQILAQVMVGQEGRLMRIAPTTACVTSCTRVNRLMIDARFHENPNDPGHCSPGDDKEYNITSVKVIATSETGARLPGVVLGGRFLDEYWTNAQVSGTTNARGVVRFSRQGPCGVGAETFLVESAWSGTRVLDDTVGVLANWVIAH